jgi:hypothetical protein
MEDPKNKRKYWKSSYKITINWRFLYIAKSQILRTMKLCKSISWFMMGSLICRSSPVEFIHGVLLGSNPWIHGEMSAEIWGKNPQFVIHNGKIMVYYQHHGSILIIHQTEKCRHVGILSLTFTTLTDGRRVCHQVRRKFTVA